MVQRNPENIDLRLRLAEQYELTGQAASAEKVYDQILAQQKNNLKALVRKAVLRHIQNDPQGAAQLFQQAEKIAPDVLKPQVRALARNTLNSTQEQIKLKPGATALQKSDL
jgi:tetratricopeptide (TPR) repeat protein